MTKVYQVRSWRHRYDHEVSSEEQARHIAESFEEAEMITWMVEPNWGSSGVRYKSLALDVWEGGNWRHAYIHG